MVDFDVGASFAHGNRIVARTNILQNLYRDKAIYETPKEVIDTPRNLAEQETKQNNLAQNLQELKTYDDKEDENKADNIQQKRLPTEIHELGIKPEPVIVAQDDRLTNEFRQTRNALALLKNSLRNLASHQAGDSLNATAIRAKIRGLESELSLLQLRARAKDSEEITKAAVTNFDDFAFEKISQLKRPQEQARLNQLLEQRAIIVLENQKNGNVQSLDKEIENIAAQNQLRSGGFESQLGQQFLDL